MKLFLQNAVLRIARSINAPKRKYGQNGDFWDLPVNDSPRLKTTSLFARKKTSFKK